MPVTIDEIKQLLDSLGLRYMNPVEEAPECGIRLPTRSYVDLSGDSSLLIVCRIDDDGEYLELSTPRLLDASACKYKGALFASMLHIALRTKHVQLEHDPTDGEVRFAIDVPVCDGRVTEIQLGSMLSVLVGVIESYYPVLRHAMETGRIDLTKAWQPPDDEEGSEDDSSPPSEAELEALVERFGGIDELEAALAQLRARGEGE